MKKHWLLGVVALMLASSVVAQSSNNQDEVVKIERHAARDYREGEMIVKFKPTSEVRVRARGRSITSGVSGVDKVLGELGITASEQLMPLTGSEVTPRAKALRSVTGNTIEDADMSQLYRLTFDAAKTNVHEAIDKLSALDEVEYAEPNYVAYALSTGEIAAADKTDDPLKGEQWGHGQLKLDFLQKQKPITDKRPVIAILDTGIDIEHPDLKDNIWTNEAEANASMLRKALARVLAVVSPTKRIPNANSTLSKGTSFEARSPSMILTADFFPMRSKQAISGAFNV